MSLTMFEGKPVLAVCSFSPLNQDTFWLTVYTDKEATLTRVTKALEPDFAVIDQDSELSFHTQLHSGNAYGADNDYLHNHDQTYNHKHYTIAGDDISVVVAALAAAKLI